MFLIPGGVDTHTYLLPQLPNPPQPNANTDDYTSGSAAALAGGATTISNFIAIEPQEDASAYAGRVIGQIRKTGIADFFIHVNMGNDPVLPSHEPCSTSWQTEDNGNHKCPPV